MKVAIFSSKPYDEEFLRDANEQHRHELTFLETRLHRVTAPLAEGFECVCPFVNDQLDAGTLLALSRQEVRLIALRSAGFNHVDLEAASDLGLTVVRVPAYSPEAVAEHTLALLMALNRKTHRAYNRVRDGDFSLHGLLGFNLNEKTVGIIGTGKIGLCLASILRGFGCRVIAHDPYPNEELSELGGDYVKLRELFEESDIISLHCPLTSDTHHLIDGEALARMKRGVMILNTSRGALVDTQAVIQSLKSGRIGFLGLDVYEEEADLFFEDYSQQIIQDDVFARLLTFPNVVITSHQGFFTDSALKNIAATTLANISEFEEKGRCRNEVQA